MKHPGENQLALFAGGELSLLEQWKVKRHVGRCTACETIVQDYREVETLLRRELNELPERLNWNSLASEMTGNIRVGVAAGECVALVRKPDGFKWGTAVALGGVTALVLGGILFNAAPTFQRGGKPGVVRSIGPGITLEAKHDAIEWRKAGSQLMLMHPNGNEGTALYGSAPGSLRVSFVDKDTGQVTINRVYAD